MDVNHKKGREKMKKTLKLMVFTIFVLSITVLTLGSCDFDISGILGEYVCVHEWSEWDIVEQGDCKTPGLIQRECLNCGAIDEETTALKEHTEGEWVVDKEATCIEDGSKHTECTVCGTIISTEIIISTGEHIESDWVVDKEATCVEDGSKHTECTICEIAITEESIDATGTHKYENHNCIYCGLTSEECFEFAYLTETDSYEIKVNQNCDLPSKISLPSTYNGKYVTSIRYLAFAFCSSLTSVVIPDSVTSIGNQAFRGCSSLTSVVIGDSVTSIGDWAFYYCNNLTSVVIGNNVASIGSMVFYGCHSLTNISIPDSVTSIGGWAFQGCFNLTSVVLGDGISYINEYMFSGCSSLTSIVLGKNVNSIDWYAFDGCYNLAEVYYNGTKAEWYNVFISANNIPLENATKYYYSESEPTTEGNFWHWGENGEVVVWE